MFDEQRIGKELEGSDRSLTETSLRLPKIDDKSL
jgi:hypothetical protein